MEFGEYIRAFFKWNKVYCGRCWGYNAAHALSAIYILNFNPRDNNYLFYGLIVDNIL